MSTVLAFGVGAAYAKGDTLTIAAPAEAKTLDPHLTNDSSSHNVMKQIYESLVTYNDKQEIVSLLAEKWEVIEGGYGHVFYLKKGVKFHNGEELKADDVVFSFKRACSPIAGAVHALSMYIDADKIEKVDDYTVIIRTKQPMTTAFLASMNHPWSSILNKKAVEAAGKDYGMNPVGTGRFTLKSWAKGDRVNLARFEEYHGEKAKISNIVIRTLVEAATRTIELESGAIDLALDPPAVDIKRLKENKNLKVTMLPGQRLFYVGLEVNKAPYDNIKVRQAMNLVANREGIVKAVFKNYAVIANGPVSSAVKYNKNDTTVPVKRDIEKAKALLKEAGYPNGFSGELLTADRTEYMNCATVLQENFRQIGIDMKIKVYEWGTFMGIVSMSGHEPFIQNWWGGSPALDPFFFMTTQFHSAAAGKSNWSHLKDPEIDALLDKGASLSDGPEREAVYHELWDKINAQVPWIYLATPSNNFASVKELEGIRYTPSLVNYFGNAYFTEK